MDECPGEDADKVRQSLETGRVGIRGRWTQPTVIPQQDHYQSDPVGNQGVTARWYFQFQVILFFILTF